MILVDGRNIGDLRALATRLLMQRGVARHIAHLQSNVLIEAELRGLPSQGLQRLPRLLSRLERGLANPRTAQRVRTSRPSEADQPVAVPGDGARSRRAKALATGIELPEEVMERLAVLDAA